MKISHTRAVPLEDLTGLCFILGISENDLSVKELALKAVNIALFKSKPIEHGDRLPTRINHRIISLRKLELVEWYRSGTHIFYRLNDKGIRIFDEIKHSYSGQGEVEMSPHLRAIWRRILADSRYVRELWLRYFMNSSSFSLEDLITKSTPISIIRVPPDERDGIFLESDDDSGYRIESPNWNEHVISPLERREILQGLKRWTEDVYLTDDSVLSSESFPFAHLSSHTDRDIYTFTTFIVKKWLDPTEDLLFFEDLINQEIDEQKQGNRINIPDLIINLSEKYGYAKENLKEMLGEIFYERRNSFFFERGSQFLITNAFKLINRDKPAVYYIKLEGAWRTSLVRYNK